MQGQFLPSNGVVQGKLTTALFLALCLFVQGKQPLFLPLLQ